jgi:hypothetical protein
MCSKPNLYLTLEIIAGVILGYFLSVGIGFLVTKFLFYLAKVPINQRIELEYDKVWLWGWDFLLGAAILLVIASVVRAFYILHQRCKNPNPIPLYTVGYGTSSEIYIS